MLNYIYIHCCVTPDFYIAAGDDVVMQIPLTKVDLFYSNAKKLKINFNLDK